MATSDGDVEQLLASRTATPITQLKPDLSDQATRKIHGEVTVTWPYSSVSKRLAFLLAEPDFRLRREKGQVRIVLNGPSAEEIGSWELGSGDEVTLALDGVEWATDEEPARPPGSRLDWQLRFSGKLMLKVTLGETQETRFINLDQPLQTEPIQVPVPEPVQVVPEPVQAVEPVHFAEIDTAVSDDEPPTAKPSYLSTMNEYASPIFVKRSRASYGPLFEFNLDGELEEDGGRRNKGRKRPRYSVQNGRWRYREESDSPEPEVLQEEPSPTPEQEDDVVMQDTPSKPQMADGACQTEESDLLPPPESAENTPSKGWNKTEPLFAFGNKVLGQSDTGVVDTAVQASPPKARATVSNEHQQDQPPAVASAPTSTNPFSFAPDPTFPQIESSVRAGFGVSQTEAPANVPANPQLQASSLFGTGPAPAQPMFGQPSNIGAGFGVLGGSLVDSVRFGFGQPSQSTLGGMQSTTLQQAPQYYDAHYYSASYPDPQQSDRVSPDSHYTHGELTQNGQRDREAETTAINVHPNRVASHEVPLWPIAAQRLDSSHAVGHLNAPEELRSDGGLAEETPPGMIPPAVEDGMRNRDEMREEGLLSEPVFEQGVSRQALPHGREGSADEDEESMDSDEEADYDEDEKGDDYDMRNYDRVSDDDEGFDGEEEDVPDGGMLDDDGEEFYDDEEDYDEEEAYEEDDYAQPASYQPAPQPAIQPAVQKAPVVIDLLSDSDDEEEEEAPQAPPPPRSDVERHQMDGIAKSEPEDDRGGEMAREERPKTASPEQQSPEAERRQEIEEDLEQELEEQVDDAEGWSSRDEQLSDDESGSEYEDGGTVGEGSELDENEPGNVEILEDLNTIRDHATVDTKAIAPEVEVEEALSSPLRPHEQLTNEANVSEEVFQVEEMVVDVAGAADTADAALQKISPGNAMSEDGGSQDDVVDDSIQTQPVGLNASVQSKPEIFSASLHAQPQQSIENNEMDEDRESNDDMFEFQTQPAELVASIQVQSVTASFQTQIADLAMTDLPESPLNDKASQGGSDEDVVMDDASRDAATGDDQVAVPEGDADEADMKDSMMQRSPMEDADLVDEGDDDEDMTTEPQAQEDSEMLEAKAASGEELESHAESVEDDLSAPVNQAQLDEEEHQALPEAVSEPLGEEIVAASSPSRRESEPDAEQAVEEPEEEGPHTPSVISEEDFHDASELPETDESRNKDHNDGQSSFRTAESPVSEYKETEKIGSSPTSMPKRKSRKAKQDTDIQLAALATASSKGQRVPSEQPPSPRTTRNKTMSFQKAQSPQNSHEDMSIQLARAALKSPSRNKASANPTNKGDADLVTRLGNDMPDCAPLKDLKTYNQNNLDVAAVATSEPTPPKRTKTRQYATCFTVTDPSVAPDGVIEVSLFRAHKEHLPIVRPGDSILLRGFTVTALPDRGFGLQTHPEESSWAVFDTDEEDALPQIRGPPVELNDEEKGYLTDLRGWYAALDEGAKDKLTKAAGEMVEKGKKSRGEI